MPGPYARPLCPPLGIQVLPLMTTDPPSSMWTGPEKWTAPVMSSPLMMMTWPVNSQFPAMVVSWIS